MTRVIAGSHRGRRLRTPAGPSTRPTADRVREGLFSSLQSLLELDGAVVLDLFAGSGALAFEALSRGAARATLVENGPEALAVIRANAELLGYVEPELTVRGVTVERFLSAPGPDRYDLVLADPPYDLAVDALLAGVRDLVTAGGVVVLERRTRGPAPSWPEGLEGVRDRRYGEATLWYGFRS